MVLNRKAGLWVVAAVLLLGVGGVLAQGRIGFVNTERIFRESDAAKRAEKKLEGEFSKRERELSELTTRLRTDGEKFQKDIPVMSESQRNQRQRALGDLELDVNRKQREFNEDVNRRRNEEFSTVLQSANRALKQIAEKEGFDAVFQDAAYANPKLDLTDKVLKALAESK